MKVLFIGLGGIGQRHLRNLKHLLEEQVTVYAFRQRKADFVLDNALEIKEGLSLEKVYGIINVASVRDALEEGMDMVFVTNPSSLHMDVLLEAANYQCSIFVEKPVSDNLDYFQDLMKRLDQNRNITFVGYQNRFHPCIKKAKEMIDKEILGEIVSIHAEVGEDVRTWHKYEDYKTMYAARKELGGGVVLSQIHELDYIIWFLGMPQQIYAIGGKLSELDIDVEDTASILMNYEIRGKRVPVYVYQDYIQNPPSRKCKIIGTKGRVEFDLLTAELIHYNGDGRIMFSSVYNFERNEMFIEELKEFLAAIRENRKTSIPLEEGVKSLKVALAVKRSIDTCNIVLIDEKR